MHRDNLLKLATKLESLPKSYTHFDMFNFTSDDLEPDEVTRAALHNCGTVACALGHGPTIRGLGAEKDEDWYEYCERVFDVACYGKGFDFLFGPKWARTDNTPTGAAKRIRYALEHGVPEGDEDTWTPEIYNAHV